MSIVRHLAPLRDVESENDQLRQLLIQAGVEAHAHVVAAKLQTVLIGELHHRVKNMLAIASAIASQSLREATSVEAAAKTIASRLAALGVSHDLLIRESWTGAGCRSLIENAILAFQTEGLAQFTITGENVAVSSGPAVGLSMVIHELCTNALTYGALSVPDGRVCLHHGQGHLVRQVPGAVHDIRSLGRFVVQVQGQVMLDRRYAGEVIGIGIPAGRAGYIGGRGNVHRYHTSLTESVRTEAGIAQR